MKLYHDFTVFRWINLGYMVVQLVEELHYKPEGPGSIPDGVTGIFH